MSEPSGPEGAERSRPTTESSYEIPEDDADLLDWAFVGNVMANDREYWVATVGEHENPHTRPVWGVWVDDTFHCGGGAETRWVKNLTANPAVTVHRQDAEKVVIIEGEAERLDEATDAGGDRDGDEDRLERDGDEDRLERIDDAYEQKYDVRHGTPVFAIHPDRVLAWTDFPTDATKWTFE